MVRLYGRVERADADRMSPTRRPASWSARATMPENSEPASLVRRRRPSERDMSNGERAAGDGEAITIRGTRYAKGLGLQARADVAFYLGGNCTRLTAAVGLDDEVAPNGSVTFGVVADGRTLTESAVVTGASDALPLDVDVTGVQQLDLVVSDGGDGNANDHADWADWADWADGARLACGAGCTRGAPDVVIGLSLSDALGLG